MRIGWDSDIGRYELIGYASDGKTMWEWYYLLDLKRKVVIEATYADVKMEAARGHIKGYGIMGFGKNSILIRKNKANCLGLKTDTLHTAI